MSVLPIHLNEAYAYLDGFRRGKALRRRDSIRRREQAAPPRRQDDDASAVRCETRTHECTNRACARRVSGMPAAVCSAWIGDIAAADALRRMRAARRERRASSLHDQEART